MLVVSLHDGILLAMVLPKRAHTLLMPAQYGTKRSTAKSTLYFMSQVIYGCVHNL